MADLKISELPAADPLDGTELVPIVQGGLNKSVTTQDIADLGAAGGGGSVDYPLTRSGAGTSVKFTDDFNRADGGLGSNYTTVSGAAAISSNQAVNSSGTAKVLVTGSSFTDGYVEGKISSSGCSLVMRSDSGFSARYQVSRSGTAYNVYAAGTLVTSFTGANSGTAVVRLQCIGSNIKVFEDGVEKVSVTDTTYAGAGQAGIELSAGGSCDNFAAMERAAITINSLPTGYTLQTEEGTTPTSPFTPTNREVGVDVLDLNGLIVASAHMAWGETWAYSGANAGVFPPMSAGEENFWRVRAALLDPKAYQFFERSNATVPTGCVWYALNMWRVYDASSNQSIFQRLCDVDHAIALPAGTTVNNDGSNGYSYICKPEVVWRTDARYATGYKAKALYYDRLNKLRFLTRYDLTVSCTAADTMGTTKDTSFPADFTNGMLACASVHDMAWVGLKASNETMNLQNEVSDDHQIRFAQAIRMPFTRATFPTLRGRVGRVDGANSGNAIAGFGSVIYYKLPSGW